MSKTGLPTPAELGVGSQYAEWRADQGAAFAAALNCSKFAIALNCPTGMGKTVLGVSFRQLSGARTCFLTKNNGLLDIYGELFKSIGLNVVKGMSNYVCDGMSQDQFRMWRMTARTDQPPTCEDGPCHDGAKCDLKKAGCKYYDAVHAAGGFTATNYSFWLANQEYSQEKVGPYDLLVLDEADAAPEELARFMSEEITTWEVENLLRARWPKLGPEQLVEWAAWARLMIARVDKMLEPGSPIRGRERKMIRVTAKKVSTVVHAADTTARWLVSDTVKGKSFSPLWPAPYKDMLFRDAKQVLLMSATVMPKTLKLLGLDESQYEFHQYPSSFPIERRRITRIPTIQVKSTTPAEGLSRWVGQGDNILRTRLDRKGIWHTVSYHLASWVLRESRFSHMMVSHEGEGRLKDHGHATVFRTAKEAIAYYKANTQPCYLVSPSISTGYDFAGRECEINIIGKLAFPDTRDPIMAARCQEDDEYRAYVVMRELVQQTGRSTRSETDFSETFILDDMAEWFLRRWGYLAPYWWAEAYRELETVPGPPLNMRAA